MKTLEQFVTPTPWDHVMATILMVAAIYFSMFQSFKSQKSKNTMNIKYLPLLLLVVVSCEPEEILVEKIVEVRDTVWIEKPPTTVTVTQTDTVYVVEQKTDTVTVTQQVVVTDTVLVVKETVIVDTVYQQVVETKTIIELDTVYITQTEIVESRLTIVHPGIDNYNGVYHYNDAITEWLRRAKEAGLKPKAATVIFTPVHWGNPTFGAIDYLQEDGSYLVYMEIHDNAAIWRSLSKVLLDIPFIESGSDIEYYDDWWEGETVGVKMKPQYDHLMFQFFPFSFYEQATPEKQDWYWNDMFN